MNVIINFFYNVYIDSFNWGNGIGVIFGVCVWIVTLICSWVLLHITLEMIDYIISSRLTGVGRVVDKQLYNRNNNIVLNYDHADSNQLCIVTIEIDSLKDTFRVNYEAYNLMKINKSVNVTYGKGKIFKCIYIKEII